MQKMNKAINSAWISIPKPNPQARARLFCFPYAGGGAFEFRAWAYVLPETIEVCAVMLPGREARLREKPYTHLPALCESLAQVLAPDLDKPFAFFGHSLGAFTAFEMMRQLRRQNHPSPRHLFVSGSRAPQLPNPETPVAHLPDHELVREVRGRYDGIPNEVVENREMLELLLPALRADFMMSETYVYAPEAPLACPITGFGGRQDRSASPEHLESWREQTRHPFVLHMFDGDHFFIKNARRPMLQIIEQSLT